MKVKVLCRNPDDYLRETKRDLYKVPRNYDPNLHPFEAPREYIRALNAVKLERVFAKPFIGNLEGHKEGVSCIVKHPARLSSVASGSYDGEVRIWDLPQQACIHSFQAHDGFLRGITFHSDGQKLITVGDDKTIKTWPSNAPKLGADVEPLNTILSRTVLMGVSHNYRKDVFATCGELCQIWEHSRNEPIHSYQWGVDSLHTIAFNPVESDLLVTCASDRSIILYDTRDTGPMRKLVMTLRTNQISWNPMEPFVFTTANEDYNLYSFDMRKLNAPFQVHCDHTSAVITVDYSPTGKEFVSGSYDKSIRIFEAAKGHSRDIYHTKRMQRLTSVAWSLDNKYILSGSDEMNIRIWKARASEKLGVLRPREKAAFNYNESLKAKFAAHPHIRRIAHHRQVPKHIYNAQKEHRIIKEKQKKKEARRRAHSKPGSVPFISEKKKHIVKEQE
ncbi:DDB1- and CUL4-associated factor 13 [Schistocerca nitens]|uniref:DDB1- and CUL4-associated factor 13 n=1 Tax=Schistocerca nitens TaxID=7011 RepID=UPI00211937A3|nr:DDB1- and CUL4-associated factor 13 [Schistocerca nitens]